MSKPLQTQSLWRMMMSNDDEGDEDGDEQNPCAPASAFLSQLFADTCCGMLFVPTSNIGWFR